MTVSNLEKLDFRIELNEQEAVIYEYLKKSYPEGRTVKEIFNNYQLLSWDLDELNDTLNKMETLHKIGSYKDQSVIFYTI